MLAGCCADFAGRDFSCSEPEQKAHGTPYFVHAKRLSEAREQFMPDGELHVQVRMKVLLNAHLLQLYRLEADTGTAVLGCVSAAHARALPRGQPRQVQVRHCRMLMSAGLRSGHSWAAPCRQCACLCVPGMSACMCDRRVNGSELKSCEQNSRHRHSRTAAASHNRTPESPGCCPRCYLPCSRCPCNTYAPLSPATSGMQVRTSCAAPCSNDIAAWRFTKKPPLQMQAAAEAPEEDAAAADVSAGGTNSNSGGAGSRAGGGPDMRGGRHACARAEDSRAAAACCEAGAGEEVARAGLVGGQLHVALAHMSDAQAALASILEAARSQTVAPLEHASGTG